MTHRTLRHKRRGFTSIIAVLVCLSLSIPLIAKEGIREIPEIFGLESLSIIDQSIAILKDTSLKDIHLFVKDTEVSASATVFLEPGETFNITDRHHIFQSYKFLRMDSGQVILEWNNHNSFPEKSAESKTETIRVVPYKRKK